MHAIKKLQILNKFINDLLQIGLIDLNFLNESFGFKKI